MEILVLKLTATPLLILAASLAGQRWGETIGGWFIGLPLTSGPVVFFLALDQGAAFAAAAAAGALAGAIAEAGFCLAYGAAARRFCWLKAVLAGTAAFFASCGALKAAPLPPVPLALLAGAALLLALRLLPAGSNAPPEAALRPSRDIAARMATATALELTLTEAAPLLGPRWSGLLATYPAFAAVLAGFAHRRRGAAAAMRVLRGLLAGLFGFCGFFLVVAVGIERAGITAAFAAAVTAALIIQGGTLWILRLPRANG